LQGEVLTHIKSKLYDGISSQEIYQHILEYLEASQTPYIKGRYSLKESIMMLGPTGYPFEDFVARILEANGYTTKVRQILSGKCVTHEVDVLADKNGKSVMIEAKFHNSPGVRSEIQVAMYTQARFEDVRTRNKIDEAWLVTNTKTTVDANTYGQCAGLKVISWSYPEGESLRELIERTNLHPVTMLTSLSQSQKLTLLENHIVLCKDIQRDKSLLNMLYLSKQEREKVLAEVEFIYREENIQKDS
jgi:Holliday junction resolvase-like predicted endonuclease